MKEREQEQEQERLVWIEIYDSITSKDKSMIDEDTGMIYLGDGVYLFPDGTIMHD